MTIGRPIVTPSVKLRRVIAIAVLVALPAVTLGARSRASRIRQFANRWLGTPYQWGGSTRAGIDCSAFLRQMYRDLFNVELPRTTRQQIRLGLDIPIDPKSPSRGLEPGDLIFYIDRDGVPNHVVVYAGGNMITHSVSGRGVVMDPIRKVFGRRIVGRRMLVPNDEDDDLAGFRPIPPAGPIVPLDIPCPPSIKAKRHEIRRFAGRPIGDLGKLGERDICDFRALAEGLRKRGGKHAEQNAKKLEAHSEWLQSIEALKGEIGRGW